MNGRPSGLQTRILNRLWDLGGVATVHEILAAWGTARVPGYTTVLKVLQIMEAKGFVSHERRGRAYRYRALLERREVSRGRFQELLHGLFGGDRIALVSSLIDEIGLSEEEVRAVRRRLARRGKHS